MSNYRHGKSSTKIYGIWSSMKARCYNPEVEAYRDYGARGITVCDRWHSFSNFYADMGNRPKGRTLDRIDNDLGYSPENCRWAPRKEQARNRRLKRLITAFGQTKSLVEWSEHYGIKQATIWARINKGWLAEDAVSRPLVTRRAGIPRGRKIHEYQ